LAGALACGWSAIVGRHQCGARVLLRRLLVLRERRRVAPGLRGMAGIDLTGIRHKTGCVSADGSAARAVTTNIGPAAARAAVAAMRMRPFMTNLPWLVLQTTAKGPVSFRRAAIELGQVRTRPSSNKFESIGDL
jgi:hypothetical protein